MSDHDPALIEKAAVELGDWLFRMHGLVSSCNHHDEVRAVLDAVADDLRAKAWTKGYVAGWDDRREDEDNPLPAGEQHDTPNPYHKEADRG